MRQGRERANPLCSKSFTLDARMIKGFHRPGTRSPYLHVVVEIRGVREKDVRRYSRNVTARVVTVSIAYTFTGIISIYPSPPPLRIIFYFILLDDARTLATPKRVINYKTAVLDNFFFHPRVNYTKIYILLLNWFIFYFGSIRRAKIAR